MLAAIKAHVAAFRFGSDSISPCAERCCTMSIETGSLGKEIEQDLREHGFSKVRRVFHTVSRNVDRLAT